ncbi:hypothetical protein C5L14_21140 [Labrys okinawensis]|uniref:Uncharacterized protein n=1 Tax=Labrys okinawensis TaxID=346911 RepID=A0A2S9Q815_9HYPH|nr:hypothetical protein C5L14_21140 [Labrys okinawensis]
MRQGQAGAIDLLEIAALLIGARGRIAGDGLFGLGTRALDFLGLVAGAVLLLVDGRLLGVELALGGEPGGEGGAIARRSLRDQRAVAFLCGLQIASGKAAAARRHVSGRRLEFGLAFPVALGEARFVVEGVLARGFGLVGRKTLASGGEAAAEGLQALADRLGAGAHLRRGAGVEADLGSIVGKTRHGGIHRGKRKAPPGGAGLGMKMREKSVEARRWGPVLFPGGLRKPLEAAQSSTFPAIGSHADINIVGIGLLRTRGAGSAR